MRRRRFEESPCPIARATDLMGDGWTPVLMREAFLGRRRFDDFQRALGVSRGVLSERLAGLVEQGLLEKRAYTERPLRHEYAPTEKGRDFFTVLAAMWRFGEDWLWPDGEETPLSLVDRDSGARVSPRVVDENTGRPIEVRELLLERGSLE